MTLALATSSDQIVVPLFRAALAELRGTGPGMGRLEIVDPTASDKADRSVLARRPYRGVASESGERTRTHIRR